MRAARGVVVLVVAATLGGCASSGVPGRAPEVTGTVSSPAGDEPSLAGASDDYYEGMPLRLADVVVVDAEGRPTDAPGDGDRVEVWIANACQESYPVQCDVDAVRVLG